MDTKNLDTFNVELLKMLEPEIKTFTTDELQEQLQAKKERAYAQHLKHLEYNKNWREKNREYYNSHARLRMIEHCRDNPVYKEKQKAAYYKRHYGVSTLEEVKEIKAERTKIRIQELLEKIDNQDKTIIKRGKKVASFEEYTKNI